MAPTNSNRINAKTKRKRKTSSAVSEDPLPRQDDKENSSPTSHPPPINPKQKTNELYENNWWKINIAKASSLIEKCMKSYGWDRNETKRLFASYRKFLLLKKEMADWDATRLMPCFPIDLIWQEHIGMDDYDANMRDLLGHVIRRRVPEETETTPAGGNDAAPALPSVEEIAGGNDAAAALPSVEEMLTEMEQTTREALKRRFGTRHDDEIWDVVRLSFVDQLGDETVFEANLREPLSISCVWYAEEVKKESIDKYQFTYDGTVIPTSGDDSLASDNKVMSLVTLVSLGFDRHSNNTKIVATRTDRIKIAIQHSSKSKKYEQIYLIDKETMMTKIFDVFAKEALDTERSKLVFLNGDERVFGHESPIALGLEGSQCDIVIQAVAAELHKSKNCICCNTWMGLAEDIKK